MVKSKYQYQGLEIEELQWQLPYGRPTEAILLKPSNASSPLPGVLALHDHGGQKYFGKRKITRTGDDMHPVMEEHQQHYYSGKAWANEWQTGAMWYWCMTLLRLAPGGYGIRMLMASPGDRAWLTIKMTKT